MALMTEGQPSNREQVAALGWILGTILPLVIVNPEGPLRELTPIAVGISAGTFIIGVLYILVKERVQKK